MLKNFNKVVMNDATRLISFINLIKNYFDESNENCKFLLKFLLKLFNKSSNLKNLL